MTTEPMVPFSGTKHTLPEFGRLVTHNAVQADWECRWCRGRLTEEPTASGGKVVVCLSCDRNAANDA